jgi:hypothetical protein
MPKDSLASIVSGQDEREAAEQMHRMFTYLAQNPQHYQQARQHMIEADMLDPEDLPEQMTPQQLAQAAQALSPYAGPPGIGDMLAQQGRNGDTMMAHVNPQEMQLLQAVGDSGTINPKTGQPEFFKKVLKPVVGATLGFIVGGPVGAVIGGSAGYTAQQVSDAQKSASKSAQEQQQLAQQAEDRRFAEEQAAAQQRFDAQQAAENQRQSEMMAAEQRRVQELQAAENRRRAEAEAEAARIRAEEERRQQNIAQGQREISSIFGQFNDDFFNQRQQAYMDFAMPQLDRQYQDQLRQLTASLARSGNLNSSLRGNLMGQLQREYDTGKLTLADQGRGLVDQKRNNITQAQARLMQSNAQLANPGLIRNSAMAEAQGFLGAPQFQNLGQLLSDLSANVGPSATTRSAQNRTPGVQLFGGGAGGSARLVS